MYIFIIQTRNLMKPLRYENVIDSSIAALQHIELYYSVSIL